VRTWRFRAAGAAVAVFAIALSIALTLRPGGESISTSLDDATEAFAAYVAALFTALAARHERGRVRWAWAALCGYALLWGAGQSLWLWKEVIRQEDVPTLWWTDACFLTSSLFALVAAVLFQPVAQTTLARLRGFLDALLIGSALVLVGWATVMGAVFDASGFTSLEKTVMLAYPVGDVVVVTVLITAALRYGARVRGALLLVTLGIVGIFVADGWYAYQNATGTFGSGTPLDAMWTNGFLLVGLGGLAALLSPRQDARPAGIGDELSRFGRFLPLGLVVVACVVTAYQRLALGHTHWVVLGSMISLVLLASIRQVVTLTDNAKMGRSLAEQATRDSLTGLLNRRAFRLHLLEALQECGDGDAPCAALLYLDLDGFKAINDGHGHAAGDALLTTMGRRLAATVRGDDMVARLGGDEFAVLVRGDVQQAALLAAERIRARVCEPVHLGGTEMMVSVSIGIAFASAGDTPETLLGHADVAMYRAKAAGRNRHEVFDAETHRTVVERLRLQADLRVALERHQLLLHYQPICDLHSGRVVGAEALVRWNHPEHGLLTSEAFVPLAEETGTVVEMGRWILREACAQAAQWQADGLFYVSVNVTARQLREPEFVRDVYEALVKNRLAPLALVLEVTESDVMEESNAAGAALLELRQHGVRIAMDDFGTGYSSLSNLCSIPVDILKTDGMFVRAAAGTPGALVASSILALGSSLGLTLVAEGIEDAQCARAMAEMGYRYGQGFHLGRPAPADQLTALGFLPRSAGEMSWPA